MSVKKDIKYATCDWKSKTEKQILKNKSKIYKHKGFRWSGIKKERYKFNEGGWEAISRNTLIGSHGETTKFHLRYFEIQPGGYSSMERHKHEHVVICVRGKGKVLIDKKTYTLEYLDTAYIAPNDVHQLRNPYNEPFGFFCIVNSKRDKPKIVSK